MPDKPKHHLGIIIVMPHVGGAKQKSIAPAAAKLPKQKLAGSLARRGKPTSMQSVKAAKGYV